MEYEVNGHKLTYYADGAEAQGDDRVLLEYADDLSKNNPWSNDGYVIQPLFNTEEYSLFQQQTRSLLLELWNKSGLTFPENFRLEDYHQVANDRAKHLQAVEQTKLISTSGFPLGLKRIEERISAICSVPLIALNPFDSQSVFHFRVVRPGLTDNNPLHRDIWLEDYKDCINIYIPIAGSNERSSLILLPGSHRWPESDLHKTAGGAVINGVKFNVPAVTKINRSFDVARPNPRENEVLVFSPYLVHGGAVNLNRDTTRISIEMRFWRR